MLHSLSDYYIIQKNFLYLHLYVAMVDHFGHFLIFHEFHYFPLNDH